MIRGRTSPMAEDDVMGTEQRGAKRTPAGAVRGALVDAAHRVLRRDGAAGLTVRAVANEAGVAPMGVYNHFDGKPGLLTAVVTEGFVHLGDAIASADDADPLDRLRTTGRRYRQLAIDSPNLYRLMFASDVSPDLEISYAALNSLTEVVRFGQRAGAIREGDPFELTVSIWSAVHGAVSLEIDAPSHDSVQQWGHIYEQTLELILRGVAAG